MVKTKDKYLIILGQDTLKHIETYAGFLTKGGQSGENLAKGLAGKSLAGLDKWQLLSTLINSKKPQIFAESEVSGDGSDWTLEELGILGDISIGMTVKIFDNGAHQNPVIHELPFIGHLVYTAGALLRNDQGLIPADWLAVTTDDKYDRDKYWALYERRLLPVFSYINESAIQRGRPAFLSIPGIGCGQFAGPFQGQMGHIFQATLVQFLKKHGDKFPGLKAVYYDPYNECINETRTINGVRFLVRPLTPDNAGKSQLCRPSFLGQDSGDNFDDCELYSLVAWDHVSWPGNDYYLGTRATDDGVKAAATNTMHAMTGIEGFYCPNRKMYCAPKPYQNWNEVVSQNNLTIAVRDNIYIV